MKTSRSTPIFLYNEHAYRNRWRYYPSFSIRLITSLNRWVSLLSCSHPYISAKAYLGAYHTITLGITLNTLTQALFTHWGTQRVYEKMRQRRTISINDLELARLSGVEKKGWDETKNLLMKTWYTGISYSRQQERDAIYSCATQTSMKRVRVQMSGIVAKNKSRL